MSQEDKSKDLKFVRREYGYDTLDESKVKTNPFEQFGIWFSEVLNGNFYDPNAMVLATTNKEGQPAARVVLLKSYDEKGFVFCTNYTSRKGNDIAETGKVALLFYWDKFERQVRIEGRIEKISKEESAEIFQARPYESRIGALASNQSREIPDRDYLENRYHELIEEYKDKEVPIPEFWGGYLVIPERIEFWQGGRHRLHDRILYTKQDNSWNISRLSP